MTCNVTGCLKRMFKSRFDYLYKGVMFGHFLFGMFECLNLALKKDQLISSESVDLCFALGSK